MLFCNDRVLNVVCFASGLIQPNAGTAAKGPQKLPCLWYPDPICLHCGRPNLKQRCLFVGYRRLSPSRLLPQKREVTAQDKRCVMTSEERMLRQAWHKVWSLPHGHIPFGWVNAGSEWV